MALAVRCRCIGVRLRWFSALTYFLNHNDELYVMGVYCRACQKYKIPYIHVLAHTLDEGVRCEHCGVVYTIARAVKLFYMTLEGIVILLSIYVSFYFLSAMPACIGVASMFLARLYFLPRLANSYL